MDDPSEPKSKPSEVLPLVGSVQSSEPLDDQPATVRVEDETPRAHATCCSWLVWPLLLLAAALLSLAHLRLWPRARPAVVQLQSRPPPLGQEDAWSCAEDVTLTMLPYPHSFYSPPSIYHARASLSVPLAADTLSFISMDDGGGSAGTFRVSQTAAYGSQAVMEITASYSQPGAARDVRICRQRSIGGTWALGISTPYPEGPADNEDSKQLHVELHLRLPRRDAALRINELHTNLPLYDHHFDTSSLVHFGKLNISTGLASIYSQSISGDSIFLHSQYGGIHGVYNASSALHIISEDENLVNITAFLQHDGTEAPPTTLNISTVRAPILGKIALHSTSPTATHGAFSVAAYAGLASIALAFVESPADSTLAVSAEIADPDWDWGGLYDVAGAGFWGTDWDVDLDAPTRAVVRLHEHFEGVVDLQTRDASYYRPQIVTAAGGDEGADGNALAAFRSVPVWPALRQSRVSEDGAEDGDAARGVKDARAAERHGAIDVVAEEPQDGHEPEAGAGAEEAGGDAEVVSVRGHCVKCDRVRRVEVAASESADGTSVRGGLSWGRDPKPLSVLEERGTVSVRSQNSLILVAV